MFYLKNQHHSGARRGELTTAHGKIQTPFFMPIATKGAVKTISPLELAVLQKKVDPHTCPIVLSNTYHLYLKPGLEILEFFKGLHNFMNWPHALLTDSGGFQIFSLNKLRKLSADGVEFSSHLDGSKHFLTPEKSLEIQTIIGSDIMMAFDYFPAYPASLAEATDSVNLTTAWAKRCRNFISATPQKNGQNSQLFGIVQGSTYPELRKTSAQEIVDLDFDGYAVGGLAVGETPEEMYAVLESTVPLLPADKPHYLMGVGMPEQILSSVKRGIDMFDCVLPSRNARHGTLFVHQDQDYLVAKDLSTVHYQKINLRAEKFGKSTTALDPHCHCPTCSDHYTQGYLRHLYTVNEPLVAHLATVHNLYFYFQLMKEIRDIIST